MATKTLQDKFVFLNYIRPNWRETVRDITIIAEPEYDRMMQATAERNSWRERINKAWKEQFEILKTLVEEIPNKVDIAKDPQAEVIIQILHFKEEATKAIKLMKSPEHFITFNIQAANFIDVLSDIHIKVMTLRTPNIPEEESRIIDNIPT